MSQVNRLASLADEFFTLREARLAKQKEVEALAERESEIREELIRSISKSEATGVAGQLCRVSVVTKRKPQVKDWDAFFTFVARRKRFDLLQRRVAETAVKEMWDDNKVIPGVEAFNVVDLSVSKVK